MLAHAAGGQVIHVLASERVPFYLNLLYGLLLLRRAHELEPLHEDLFRHVLPPQLLLDPAYGPDELAQDLAQLEAWGCVERTAEALKIRGYKDNRRERFRYRLAEDAVALLEWLETRLAAALEGRPADSRDRLADVLGQLKELLRILDDWRKDQRSEDSARRAFHLVSAVDDAVHELTDELLSFRAVMLAFAARPYELAALRRILEWLERYVGVYLVRIEELRRDIAERLAALAQPRHRRALAECRESLLKDLATTPRELRRGASLRATDELVDAQLPFFAESGGLVTLCARIDDSARDVLRKMHRHLRELERRSARVTDLRACIRELASLPPESNRAFTDLVNSLIASAHGRFERATARAGERRLPPLPRSHRAPAAAQGHSPLGRKSRTPDDVRALRAKRELELRIWIEERILCGREHARLSAAELATVDAPRRWLDVVRAAVLGGGRVGARLEITVTTLPGTTTVGNSQVGLDAPDAEVRRRKTGPLAKGQGGSR